MSRRNEIAEEPGVTPWVSGKYITPMAKVTATNACPSSFPLGLRPNERCLEIFVQSSRNPMNPRPAKSQRTITAERVGWVQVRAGEQDVLHA